MSDPNCCPDCGENLAGGKCGITRYIPTLYCPSCNWTEHHDGDRQTDAVHDWAARNDTNLRELLEEDIV